MSGFVYAIESGDAVKIGWANNPGRRLAELNVGSPGTHRLVGYVPATQAQEKELHTLLRPWRVRGEWFDKRARAVSAFVDAVRKPQPAPRLASSGKPKTLTNVVALKKYLADHNLSQFEFAKLVGVTDCAVKFWIAGRRVPRPEQMAAIVRVTCGAVTPNDFLSPAAQIVPGLNNEAAR